MVQHGKVPCLFDFRCKARLPVPQGADVSVRQRYRPHANSRRLHKKDLTLTLSLVHN